MSFEPSTSWRRESTACGGLERALSEPTCGSCPGKLLERRDSYVWSQMTGTVMTTGVRHDLLSQGLIPSMGQVPSPAQ